jgi:hypothetical protein
MTSLQVKLNYDIMPDVYLIDNNKIPSYKFEYTDHYQSNTEVLENNPVINKSLQLINDNLPLSIIGN